jgi:hypothetical protein
VRANELVERLAEPHEEILEVQNTRQLVVHLRDLELLDSFSVLTDLALEENQLTVVLGEDASELDAFAYEIDLLAERVDRAPGESRYWCDELFRGVALCSRRFVGATRALVSSDRHNSNRNEENR